MTITIEYFISKYVEALEEGDAAIFTGSGLSVSSGCVNWKELLKEIAQELGLDIARE